MVDVTTRGIRLAWRIYADAHSYKSAGMVGGWGGV